MKRILANRLLLFVILGIILRLIIIPITLHPDVRNPNLAAFLISQKGEILNFYDYFLKLPADHPLFKLYGVNQFNYPPFSYLFLAFFMTIFSTIYPWELFMTLVNNIDKVIGASQLPLLLYLLKSPFLVADLAGLYLIGKLFDDRRIKFKAQLFWLFNPVVIYVSYMMSQFDILVALSILAALFFYKNGSLKLGAISLGLGGLVKMFPLLLLPIYAFVAGDKLSTKIKLLLVGFGVYIIGILPYVPSVGFRRFALITSQTDKIFFAKIPVTGSEFLPLFLVGLIFLYWLAFAKIWQIQLWQYFLAVLLLFFSLTHYHPNWFVWLVAPLIIFAVSNWPKNLIPSFVLLISYVIIIFTFDKSLNFGIFAPIFTSDLSFNEIISRNFQPNVFASIIRGIFAATCAFIILNFFGRGKNSKK